MKQFKFKAMKTTKTLSALILALLLSGLTALYASTQLNSSNPFGSGIGKKEITYIVNIDHDLNLAGFACNYYVVITDEGGKAVAAAQPFRLGIWTYTFHEFSNTGNARVARMSNDPHILCPRSYFFLPETMNGPFVLGRTYNFTLTPEKQGPGIK